MRYLDDGAVPIDNNYIEQQIRPVALGKKNWLFAGSMRAGERAAAVMTLIQSSKLNGSRPLCLHKIHTNQTANLDKQPYPGITAA